jgi:hypothetical protein
MLIVYKAWPKVSDGRQSKSTSYLSTFIKFQEVLLEKKAVTIRYSGQKTDIRSDKILHIQDFSYDRITRLDDIVSVHFFEDFVRFWLQDTSKNLTRFTC